MAGIYLHIPFCRQKCNYCNFFSLATTKFRDAFFESLLKEIELTRNYLADEPIETIYFGGGTPSLFPVERLEQILQAISHEPRRTKDVGRETIIESSTANCKLQTANCKLQTANCKLQTANCQPREVTLEMNPDDVTAEYLEALSHSAINRVSLGIQSFFDEDLKYLSRSHDGKQAIRAVEIIRDAGYGIKTPPPAPPLKGRGESGIRYPVSGISDRGSRIGSHSVDLIYGIPTLTNNHWKENLQRIIDLGIPHLSAYALTVEPKTPLAWQIEKGAGRRAQQQETRNKKQEIRNKRQEIRNPKHEPERSGVRRSQTHFAHPGSHIPDPGSRIRLPVSDDMASEQFEILMDMMEQAGYIQYEISNFCLPGYESRHNSNYWRGVSYLGLGPSAHSYNGKSRRWNISNLTFYNRHLASGILPFEEELLTPIQRYNEYVMTSLRTIRGADLQEINRRFGPEFESYFRNQSIRHLASTNASACKQASGLLQESDGIYTLTRKGRFLADGIAADLFAIE